jgi:beta-ketoacyl synthase-like protein
VIRAPAVRALGFLAGREHEPTTAAQAPTAPVSSVRALTRPIDREDQHRRSTRECALGRAAVRAMLEDAGAGPADIAGDRTALLYATAAAYAPSNRDFIAGGGTIHFAYTAPAVVPAEVAIEFGLAGPYGIFLGGSPATLRAIWQAAVWLDEGTCDRALVLAVEVFAECGDLYWPARRLTGWPLVEAAGCLWLERGRGQLVLECRRGRREGGARHRAAEAQMWSCEPLAMIQRWRRDGRGFLELSGLWRGERARLAWIEDAAPSLVDP